MLGRLLWESPEKRGPIRESGVVSGKGLLESQELVGYPVFPCLCLLIFSNSSIPSSPAPTGLPKALGLRQESYNGFEMMEEEEKNRAEDKKPNWET